MSLALAGGMHTLIFALSLAATTSPAGATYALQSLVKSVLGLPNHAVPLIDLRPCDHGRPCAIVRGSRVDLAPVRPPMHDERYRILGVASDATADRLLVRESLDVYGDSPDQILAWVQIPKRGGDVRILGFSVSREPTWGAENPLLTILTQTNLYAYLTSDNRVETIVARELVRRQYLCGVDQSVRLERDYASLVRARLADDERAAVRFKRLSAPPRTCGNGISDDVEQRLERMRHAFATYVAHDV